MKLTNAVLTLILITLFSQQLKAQGGLLNDLKGAWEQEGYGSVINIDATGFKIYNICKVSCTPAEEMTWKEANSQVSFKNITPTTFTLEMGINKYNFFRLEKMPDLCTHPNVALKNDPIHNFESLWHTFNEQYCYFKTRNIDWNAFKEKYQSRLNPNSTKLELYIVLNEMLEEMEDGHVGILPSPEIRKEYSKYRELQKNKNPKPKRKGIKRKINIDKVLKGMMTYYIKDVKKYNAGVIYWGMINKDVSMVRINGMGGMATYKVPSFYPEGIFENAYMKKADKSDNYAKDEADGVRYIMSKILSKISQTKACIIDLRFNGGGMDEVALELLRYFSDEETKVFSKKAYLNPGYTDKNIVSIIPAKNAYRAQVYILTSHFTASAAEIFVMSSIRANPTAVRIGSNTEGIFSDILEKELPNGWAYGLSNEVYESMDGIDYENKGIPPHHELGYDKNKFEFLWRLKTGLPNGDEAVEKALELIKERK